MAHIPRTLIADDQPDVLAALRLLLKSAGYQTESADSPTAIIEAIKQRDFDVLLMDLNYARDTTSGKEGLDLISRIQAEDKTLPIVAMTAWGSVDLAVEAMHRGVRDFVQKPWENSRLLKVLRTQVEQGRNRRRRRQKASERREISRLLQTELKEAREIQRRLMPAQAHRFAGFEIASTWKAARIIGGDYLAAFALPEERAGLCVADVAGKGLPAALLMSHLHAALRTVATQDAAPRNVCAQLNQLMCGNLPSNKFISSFYGVLDVPRRVLHFTNAGHNPPLLVKGDGKTMRLTIGGKVLGAFADSTYGHQEIQLGSGDRLALFTDGLTEIRNATGEEFGEARVRQLLTEARHQSASELQSLIMAAATEFSGGEFEDDVALMIVAVN
ncbi:MAG TPA: SpoIIE family protein phosphatase [Pyrinomonadaceae bacterium]|nr:SpoIIE family protein phosphatase [Pyrinomonadaceae bacterium]